MTELSLLVVEDDPLQRKALHDLLTKWGHDVTTHEAIVDARRALAERPYDLVLLDLSLPDGDGMAFLEELKGAGAGRIDSDVVIITAHTDVGNAVRAIKIGAYDYLTKPYEQEYLSKIVRNICAKAELSRRVKTLSKYTSRGGDVWQFDEMIGTDLLRDVFSTAQQVADSERTTVLILGETGTGKGMLARAIHRLSSRRDKPFVDINCSAIPEQLLETELFGHEKGAFTDAKNSRAGLMEAADGGTVFLDEIGDMPLNLQSKLLKVIEEKQFRRVGGVKTTCVDVRVVAATCQDLSGLVKEGKFRRDLYYRLCVFPLTLPPLREHRNTIVPLAYHYLNAACRETGRKIKGFTPAALHAMQTYDWPGNVRELRNTVERAVIMTTGEEADVAALWLPGGTPTETGAPAGAISAVVAESPGTKPDWDIPPMSWKECEKRLIANTLRSAGGNCNKAAKILGSHRTTLYKKIKEYNLTEYCSTAIA
jgi:two-component system, NtrC family, response regulator AtoC